ncbi:hypothetical protein [Aeromonas cavernicola]|uniref:hypothetical protein n=1 Tax=Aeromonas cavernicola TaxID=1006623 RepID=UPI0012FD59FD|nr:hypothetical protein [Aeromonas cavernicola]
MQIYLAKSEHVYLDVTRLVALFDPVAGLDAIPSRRASCTPDKPVAITLASGLAP